MVVLFPSSYLNKHIADNEFCDEYNAAQEAEIETLLFDQELWDKHGELELLGEKNATGCVVYRGWMMKPEQYKQFFDLCNSNELHLINSPAEYNNCHLFKNGYSYVKDDAPKTLFFESVEDAVQNLDTINSKMTCFMVKDYVKSVKGTDFPKYFEKPNRKFFEEWMVRFLKYRGNLLTGGIQIKEYLDLKMYDDCPNEYRVFYSNNIPITISRNSNQPAFTTELPISIVEKYKNLPSKLYTVDFIECSDGSFKVIETGDGGVSGLSPDQNYYSFYRKLKISQNDEYSNNQEKEIDDYE